MTNLDKHEWEFTREEMYAIKYLEKRGFEVTVKKRFISKDYIMIGKDGFEYEEELPTGNKGINYRKLMPLIVKNFEMAKQLVALRQEAKEAGL